MSTVNWPDDSKFDPFNISKQRESLYALRNVHLLIETRYKTVSGHDIRAAVLMPKDLKPGSRPVIINVHGGLFSTAHSLFAPFFAPWAINLALDHDAIIVSAGYRLLHSGPTGKS